MSDENSPPPPPVDPVPPEEVPPEVTPAEVPPAFPPLADVPEEVIAEPVVATAATVKGRRCILVELPVPAANTPGYTPSSLSISLTPRQALAARALREGFREAGRTVNKSEDGLHHLLDLIADELEHYQ